ncbi:MAG: type 1 glutamine amidotransferase [Patescibacteria group bacterium]|nr:type 1 glutamine amidotransferase [Patescibacteria group bacterium]
MESPRKILLIVFSEDDATSRVVLAGLLASARLAPENLRIVNAFAAPMGFEVLDDVDGVIIGGSRGSVFEPLPNLLATMGVLREARRRRLPMLGICFGHQLLAASLGGKVVRDNEHEEFGTFDIELKPAAIESPLFAGMPKVFAAQCAHHDRVTLLPPGAAVLASSELCPIHAFVLPDENIYGVQFHPEYSQEGLDTILSLAPVELASHSGGISAARERLRETPDAGRVLTNFIGVASGLGM